MLFADSKSTQHVRLRSPIDTGIDWEITLITIPHLTVGLILSATLSGSHATIPSTLPSTAAMDESDNSSSDSSVAGPSTSDFIVAAQDIQNRRRPIRSPAMRRSAFREFFGTSASIACLLWHLLVESGLIPEKGQIKHLLWTLYFLKAYPKRGPACAAVGGSKGAIDPKTFSKWVWSFINSIEELEEEVVSF